MNYESAVVLALLIFLSAGSFACGASIFHSRLERCKSELSFAEFHKDQFKASAESLAALVDQKQDMIAYFSEEANRLRARLAQYEPAFFHPVVDHLAAVKPRQLR